MAGYDPVGFYASRDEAELAILRASRTCLTPRDRQSQFAEWLGQT
jgi:hypothetical protein